MRVRFGLVVLFLGMMWSSLALAQAPAGAPAGATGQCNDDSYSTAASKMGACRGHKGVKQWFAASTAAPMAAAPMSKTASAPAPAAAPAPAQAASPMTPAPASKAAKPSAAMGTPAAGGGPGMVWVNSGTNVYHCPGTKYYGLTKAGKYMTEAAAKSAGARPDHGNACTK